ncbi:hypothetical protein XENTR_v10023387 [Xenopus tropicalis]|nr:hypothetical protein XENTR_v10023387 [Xenopus tropicalis]
MNWFHLITTLLLLNLGIYGFANEDAKLSEVCGKPVVDRSRIVGGQDSKKGQHPWQVIVILPNIQCGGTLISSRFVLTAALCVHSVNDVLVYAALGAYNLTERKQFYIPVSRTIIHDRYIYPVYYYNIALLELSVSVPFMDFMLPACLPTASTQFLPGQSCMVAGWGFPDDNSNQLPFILQESEVQLISLERCRDLYREAYTNILIADTMTCAMDIHENTGISTGDLGGPLVCQKGGQWFLVGVVSLEVILELTLPVSYTSVPAYMDWINKHVFPPNGGSGLIGSMPGVALEVQSLSAFILSLRSLFWVSLQNPMFILMLSTVIWVGC